MCKTYNTIGSLTTLKSHLERNNIYEFKSLKEVVDFQHSYAIHRQQIIVNHKSKVEQEKNILNVDLQELDTAIEVQKLSTERMLSTEIDNLKQQLSISMADSRTNYFRKLARYIREWNWKRKIRNKERRFDVEVNRSITGLVDERYAKNSRYQFIVSQFDDAVQQSAQHYLWQLENKKTIIDGLTSYIYGALGEQQVVKTLEVLSDEFFLINDFALSFSTPIYNRQENDYIYSVQIDHILVAPSGIFLIETKNWSEKSLENLSLRSPVQQVKRTSFVLFRLLNNEVSNHSLQLNRHHWGDKKISIKNLIVLTNTRPKEEFQYVKVLTLTELIGYVNYFKPVLSTIETQRIADYLIDLNKQKRL